MTDAEERMAVASVLRQLAKEGSLEEVRELLQAGADVRLRDDLGDTAGALAVRHGHWDVYRVIRFAARNATDALLPRSPVEDCDAVFFKNVANHRSAYAVAAFRVLQTALHAILHHAHAMENALFPTLGSAFTATVLMFADDAVLLDALTTPESADRGATAATTAASIRVPPMSFKIQSHDNVLANIGSDHALTSLTVQAVNRVIKNVGPVDDWPARRRAYHLCASMASGYVNALVRYATPCEEGQWAWTTMPAGQDLGRYVLTLEKAPVVVTLGSGPPPPASASASPGAVMGAVLNAAKVVGDALEIVEGRQVVQFRLGAGALVVFASRIAGSAWIDGSFVFEDDVILLPLNVYACDIIRSDSVVHVSR